MPRVEIVVREPGRKKPDYSLTFDLPEIPRVGDYISIQRPDKPDPYGEDMIVRHIWWRLKHAETGSAAASPAKVGGIDEVWIECEPALSPYSSDSWRNLLEGSRTGRGSIIEEFDVERFSVRESEVGGASDER